MSGVPLIPYDVQIRKANGEESSRLDRCSSRLQKTTSQHNLTSDWRHTCPLVIRLIRREIGLRKQGGGGQRRGYDNFFVRTPRGLIKAQTGRARTTCHVPAAHLLSTYPLSVPLALLLSCYFYNPAFSSFRPPFWFVVVEDETKQRDRSLSELWN